MHSLGSPTQCVGGAFIPRTGSRYECGNGTVDPGEECDDGNNSCCDGCDGLCHLETPCGQVPDPSGCRKAGRSVLIGASGSSSRNSLTWKWLKGYSSEAEFADPLATATYTFCVFAGTTAALVGQAAVEPSGTKWVQFAGTGFRYRDSSGAVEGIRHIVLRGGALGHAKVALQAKGGTLALGGPVLPPLTVELYNSQTDVCWSATYDAADITVDKQGRVRARSSSP